MATSLEQARAAKATLGRVLARSGVDAAVGITRGDNGYALKVNLREPLPEDVHLPATVDGVAIKTEVVGVIRAR